MLARTANGNEGGEAAYLGASVNSGAPVSLYVTRKGWENWGLSTAKISLQDDENKIRFTKNTGDVELDFFDIRPVK